LAELHNLKPAEGSRKKRLRAGRGDAARRGNYSGRGSKGQKQRTSVHPRFEGGQLPLIKKLPALRGFNNPFRTDYQVVNLEKLSDLKANSKITVEDLVKSRLARKKNVAVKILGAGKAPKKLTLTAHAFSKSSRAAIEAAGGKCIVIETRAASKPAKAEVQEEN